MSSDLDDLKEAVRKGAGDMTDEQKQSLLKGIQEAGQRWLSDDEYFEQFDRGISMVKDKGSDDMLMQFWLYGRNYDFECDDKDKYVVMPIGVADWPPEGHTKQEAMEGLGILFAAEYPEHMLVNIVHTSEAWMAQHDKDTDMDNVPLPSKDPKRAEVVLVTATSIDRRLSQYIAKIERDKTGKFTGLTEIDMGVRHDPNNPKNPKDMRDYNSEYIYAGYNKLREKEREAKSKEETDDKTSKN